MIFVNNIHEILPKVSLKNFKTVVLYGYSFLVSDFISLCQKNSVEVLCIVDKKFREPLKFWGIECICFEKFINSKYKNYPIFITTLNKKFISEMKENLEKHNLKFFHILEVEEYIENVKQFLSSTFNKNDIYATKEDYLEKIEIAVILHLYYLDLAEEMAWYISRIPAKLDVYISISEENEKKIHSIEEIFKFLENVNKIEIFPLENKGRDVYPFLKILDTIDYKKYKFILKLHTKKSLHLPPWAGEYWRRKLCFELTNEDIYKRVNNFFLKDDGGMYIPFCFAKNISLDMYSDENLRNMILEILKILNLNIFVLKQQKDLYYSGGTMFWFNPKIFKRWIIEKLLKLPFTKNDSNLSESDKHYKIGYDHAVERIFGLIPKIQGFKIAIDYGNKRF